VITHEIGFTGEVSPVHKWRVLTLLLVSAGLSVAGCGAGGDRESAADAVAVRLLTAVGARDGVTACSALAPETASEVSRNAGKPCPEAVLEEDLPAPGQVTGTDVYGQWAQVRLSDDTVFLAVFPDGWKVVAAGCTSRGERPYLCAVQGS
jgi:hypothetical protein